MRWTEVRIRAMKLFCGVPAHLALLVLPYDGFPFEPSTPSLSSIINGHDHSAT